MNVFVFLNELLNKKKKKTIDIETLELFINGKSIEEMSDEYGVSQDRITSVVEKKEVKIYIDSVFATQGYLNRVKRINLINQVIDQKIADAVETGVYSKKDLLDWMKHLHEVETAARPKDKGPTVAVQVNNYDSLMREVLD